MNRILIFTLILLLTSCTSKNENAEISPIPIEEELSQEEKRAKMIAEIIEALEKEIDENVSKIIEEDKDLPKMLKGLEVDISRNHNIWFKNLFPIYKNGKGSPCAFYDSDGNMKIDFVFNKVERVNGYVIGYINSKIENEKNLCEIYIINEDGTFKKIFEDDAYYLNIETIPDYDENKLYLRHKDSVYNEDKRKSEYIFTYYSYDVSQNKLSKLSEAPKILFHETDERKIFRKVKEDIRAKDEFWLEDKDGNILSDIYCDFIAEEEHNANPSEFLFFERERDKVHLPIGNAVLETIKYTGIINPILVDENGEEKFNAGEIVFSEESLAYWFRQDAKYYDILNYRDFFIVSLGVNYPNAIISEVGPIVFYINKNDYSYIEYTFINYGVDEERAHHNAHSFYDSKKGRDDIVRFENFAVDYRRIIYRDNDTIISSANNRMFFLNENFEIINSLDCDSIFLDPLMKNGEIIYFLGGNKEKMLLFDTDFNLLKEIDYVIKNPGNLPRIAKYSYLDEQYEYRYDKYQKPNIYRDSDYRSVKERAWFTLDILQELT